MDNACFLQAMSEVPIRHNLRLGLNGGSPDFPFVVASTTIAGRTFYTEAVIKCDRWAV